MKVLTGVRGCGKTSLTRMLADELRDSHDTVRLDLGREWYGSPEEVVEAAVSGIGGLDGSLVILDEVLSVPGWERAASSLLERGAEVLVTASGTVPGIEELPFGTSEVRVRPLSFREYVSFRDPADPSALLDDYLRLGGLPAVARAMDTVPFLVDGLLEGICCTAVNKDVIGRHGVRGRSLKRIMTTLARNVGGRTSAREVARRLSDSETRVQPRTVDRYIGYLEGSLLFSRAGRYDARTGERIRTSDRFYAADNGLLGPGLGLRTGSLEGLVENAVFNELSARFGEVATCAVGRREVDFVADPMGTPSYYQVSPSITDPATMEREIRPLRAIEDNHPKTVITYDRFPMGDVDGIRIVSLLDWLTEGERAPPSDVGTRRPDRNY